MTRFFLSANADPELTRRLLEKGLRAGSLFELPGSKAEARPRWGSSLAAGKLGVVTTAEGKNAMAALVATLRQPGCKRGCSQC